MHARPTAADASGKYRLIAELGRGGMAIVYLAGATGPSDSSSFARHEKPLELS